MSIFPAIRIMWGEAVGCGRYIGGKSLTRLIIYRSLLFIILIILLITISCTASTPVAKMPMNQTDTMQLSSEKIDPSLLVEVNKFKDSSRSDKEIEVLIRTKEKITSREVATLEEKGAKVGSVIGNILTAKIPVQTIKDIAELDFIIYIEKAKKVLLK